MERQAMLVTGPTWEEFQPFLETRRGPSLPEAREIFGIRDNAMISHRPSCWPER